MYSRRNNFDLRPKEKWEPKASKRKKLSDRYFRRVARSDAKGRNVKGRKNTGSRSKEE